MESSYTDLKEASRLVGQTVTHNNQQWLVIDYLEDGPDLVLEHPGVRAIQTDQHGNGRRRAPHTISVPVLDPAGQWHPAFLALGVGSPKQ